MLAATGILDGKRAATHWFHASAIAAAHPAVTIDPAPIFIREGDVATSAGVTAALDLTLAFLEEDLGAERARTVARHMVTYLQRPGNQAQMSIFLAPPAPDEGVVPQVVDHITGHLDQDLSTAKLADVAGVSTRHLTRLFVAAVNLTPGRFVRRARVEAAAQLLVTTDLTVASIALRCGFGTTETLQAAFVSTYAVSHRPTTARGWLQPARTLGEGREMVRVRCDCTHVGCRYPVIVA